jgi:hypothetical protein
LVGIKLLKWIAPIITGTAKWVGGTILQVAATRQLTTALIIAQGAVAGWLTKIGLGTVGILKFSGAIIAGTATLLAYAAALGVVYLAIEKLGAERLARWFGMPIEDAIEFKAELDKALGVEIKLTGQAKELALALKDADKYYGSMTDRGKQLALALKDPDKFFGKRPEPKEPTKKEAFAEELKAMEARALKMREMVQIEQEVLKEFRDMAEENRESEREMEEQKRRSAEETVDYKLTLMQDYYKEIEAAAQEARDLEEELENQAIRMAEETARYQESIKPDLQKWAEDAKTWQEQLSDTAMAAAESFSSGFTDAFFEFAEGTKSAEDAFRAFAASFLKDIAKMIMQQMILNAIKTSFGGFFGTAEGGVISPKGGPPGRALGGPVTNTSPYLVGERGPEIFFPQTAGRVLSNKDSQEALQGGNNINTTIHVNTTPTGDPEEAKRQAREMSRVIEMEFNKNLTKQMRIGGLLNAA